VGRELLARNLPVERLEAAFVTHMHSDHAGGLFQFVKNLHLYHNHPDYLPQIDEITLAVPAEAVEAVKAFFTASYMFPEKMNVRVKLAGIREGLFFEDGNVQVSARRTTHLDNYAEFLAEHPEYKGPRCEAFAFEARGEGKRIVYSGDLGRVSDILEMAKGADLLILEFGHLLPLAENLARLKGLGIGHVVLTHIFPDYTSRGDELQRTADSVLPGAVTVARDGLTVMV
jgi:ribonuclease BN (tRNA processing enzyme)